MKPAATSPDPVRTPWLATVAHGVAASWFASLYAPFGTAFLAFLAGIAGSVLGTRLARDRKRVEVTSAFAAGGAVLMLVGSALSSLWFRRVL